MRCGLDHEPIENVREQRFDDIRTEIDCQISKKYKIARVSTGFCTDSLSLVVVVFSMANPDSVFFFTAFCPQYAIFNTDQVQWCDCFFT